MKKLLLGLAIALSFSSHAFASETTVSEKAKEAASEAKVEAKKAGRAMSRTAKKAVNRVEEATCMDGDMKCAAKKAGNRIEEAKDATVDAAKNAKDELSN